MIAVARVTDPETSHESAAILNRSGKLKEIKRKLYALLCDRPEGLTTLEMTDISGIPRVTVSPCLAPMWREQLVFDTKKKRTGHTGMPGIIWKANIYAYTDEEKLLLRSARTPEPPEYNI